MKFVTVPTAAIIVSATVAPTLAQEASPTLRLVSFAASFSTKE